MLALRSPLTSARAALLLACFACTGACRKGSSGAPTASSSSAAVSAASLPLAASSARALSVPDGALARVHVDSLPPVGPFARLTLVPSGVAVDNEAVVADWPDAERARVLANLPPGTRSVVEARRTVLSLGGWRVAETRADVSLESLVPLRDVLARFAITERMHSATMPALGAELHLDIALFVAETMPFELLTRVLMTAQSAGYDRFHFAVRDASGRVGDLLVLGPSSDLEGFRKASGGFCAVPRVTLGPRGFDVVAGIGALSDDVVAQPVPSDLRRLEAEVDFVRKQEGAPGASPHAAPPATNHLAASASGERGWRRWYQRSMLRHDRACPSVPSVGGAPDVASLLALVHEVKAIAPGCHSVYLRVLADTPLAEVASIAAALASESPRVVFLAPEAPLDADRKGDLDCKEGMRAADLVKVGSGR